MDSSVLHLVARTTVGYSLYPFDPIKPLPYVFAILIAILGVINIWQNFFQWKWYRFGFIMTWASSVWIAGFICRIYSEKSPTDLSLYIAQFVLTIAGPPLYGAAETFMLGRLMAYLPYHAPLHPGRVVSTFVILSAIVEVLNGQGAWRFASGAKSNPPDLNLFSVGADITNAALILQAFIEVLFLTLTSRLHYTASRAGHMPRHAKFVVYTLYVTSSMLLARCIFRAAQGFQLKACVLGQTKCGPSITNEALFWVFEAANITLFVVLLTIFTPGRYLPHSDKVFLDQNDSVTERLGPGFAQKDKRPFIVTVFDPANLYGRMRHGKQSTPFYPYWEESWPVYEGDRRRMASSGASAVNVSATTKQDRQREVV